jgi:type VI secretion system Hcp family effector
MYISRKKLLMLLVLLCSLTFAIPTSAAPTDPAQQIVLKLTGSNNFLIEGNSTVLSYTKQIDLSDVKFGFSSTATASPATGLWNLAGKVNFNKITIQKQSDKSTTNLIRALAKGSHLPKMEITYLTTDYDGYNGGPARELMSIIGEEVLITNFKNNNGKEEVTFDMVKISVTYYDYSDKGTRTGNTITYDMLGDIVQ